MNIAVAALAFRERESRGRAWKINMILVPLVGAGVSVWLLTSLDVLSLVLAGVWLAIGLVWLAALTKGFRREPPQMDFSEEAAITAEEDGEAVSWDEEVPVGWQPAPSFTSDSVGQ